MFSGSGGASGSRACICPSRNDGGKRVRTVGLARARIKIGMMNLVHNLRRLA